MINQEKSGKYIAEKRKKLGMTQKDLAEKVGLTDKAVSKWERGKSVPDQAILDELCSVLQISFNEYLSGEDISEEHYPNIAEQNMKELMIENNKEKKGKGVIIGVTFLSLILSIVGMYGLMFIPGGKLASFIDFPSFILLIGIVSLCLILSGYFNDFITALQILFMKRNYMGDQVKRSLDAIKVIFRLNIMSGSLLTIGQMIIVFNGLDELLHIIKMIPILLLPLWYGILLNFFWSICVFRLQRHVDKEV